MLPERVVETLVGLLVLAAMLALLVLSFKISGLTSFFKPQGYNVSAIFDDVGQLKVRAAVKIGGVTIGEVTSIRLDSVTFKAIVSMHIKKNVDTIPTDSVASILTAGLLGDNYIEISPRYNKEYLKAGSVLEETHSAMILEKLIGQLVFKLTNSTPSQGSKQ